MVASFFESQSSLSTVSSAHSEYTAEGESQTTSSEIRRTTPKKSYRVFSDSYRLRANECLLNSSSELLTPLLS
jgi:hypothetical protein